MVKRCIAAGCSNTHRDNVSLFSFPKDPTMRDLWTKQVKRTRSKWPGSTDYSVLCSAHFTPDCFDMTPSLMASVGLSPRRSRMLKNDAVPTLFSRPSLPHCTRMGESSASSRPPRQAYVKRERAQLVNSLLQAAKGDMEKTAADIAPPMEGINSQETDIQDNTIACQTTPDVKHVKLQVKIPGSQTGSQTEKVQMISVGIQCTILEPEVISTTVSQNDQTEADSNYEPSPESEEEVDMEESDPLPVAIPLHKENKYIVYSSCLDNLLSLCHCPSCGSLDISTARHVSGTLLIITISCSSCQKQTPWHSQPYIGDTPAGNIHLSAAILFSGATAGKMLCVLQHMCVASISIRTYFRHQKHILQPVILTEWQKQQQYILGALHAEKDKLVLGGVGRADFPGHSAIFGAYTMMELEANLVVDVQLVQSNECGGSYHMELKGLQQSVDLLTQHDLHVGTLVTDRHRQIACWIRESLPNTEHFYDVWHVAKGFAKKLKAAANTRGCTDLKPWIQSIVNHMYWCASSSQAGESELMLGKWLSVEAHIQNVHSGHGDLFPKCEHGSLEGREARKKWVAPSSASAVKLEKLVYNRSLCKDIKKLSCQHQTSRVEAFHSLVVQFAPKMYAFTHPAMLCRLALAAMHYNENGGRATAVTKTGKSMYMVHYPKYKSGGYIVKRVAVAPTYDYINNLMEQVEKQVTAKIKERAPALQHHKFLCADLQHPQKAEAVREKLSRFST